MKILILIAMMMFSVPFFSWSEEDHDHGSGSAVLAKSRVSLATVTALELFEQATPGSVWAFKTVKTDDEVVPQILYVTGNQNVRAVNYDCHFHAHGPAEEAHCHTVVDDTVSTAAPSSLPFEVDALIVALSGALDTFERKIAPLEKLTSLKMWQSQDLIFLSVTHDGGAGDISSHFMCHLHSGTDIDCHRSKNAGPNEPSF